MEEHELIKRSKQGDLNSFNQLVESYQGLVYNVALRMLGDAQAAEDAAQDTFLSAWKSLGRFKGGNFKAWLLQIAANACRDQLRHLKRHPTMPLESLSFEPLSSAESPEDYALRQELSQQIQRGLDTLPPEQRLAVLLFDIQGFSYEEVAKVMGCSLGTVKSRLSRGRAQLRDYLVKRELFPGEYRHNK